MYVHTENLKSQALCETCSTAASVNILLAMADQMS